MSLVDDIRKIAISSVLDPDNDAQLRKIHRWFSKTFQIALPDVEDLPTEYVLLHYFEELYATLDEDELIEEAKRALETPEARAARVAKENSDEEKFDKEIREEMEAQKKGENKTLKDLLKKHRVKKGLDKPQDSIKPLPKEELKPPPDVKIAFDEENDLVAKYGEMDFVPSKK